MSKECARSCLVASDSFRRFANLFLIFFVFLIFLFFVSRGRCSTLWTLQSTFRGRCRTLECRVCGRRRTFCGP